MLKKRVIYTLWVLMSIISWHPFFKAMEEEEAGKQTSITAAKTQMPLGAGRLYEKEQLEKSIKRLNNNLHKALMCMHVSPIPSNNTECLTIIEQVKIYTKNFIQQYGVIIKGLDYCARDQPGLLGTKKISERANILKWNVVDLCNNVVTMVAQHRLIKKENLSEEDANQASYERLRAILWNIVGINRIFFTILRNHYQTLTHNASSGHVRLLTNIDREYHWLQGIFTEEETSYRQKAAHILEQIADKTKEIGPIVDIIGNKIPRQGQLVRLVLDTSLKDIVDYATKSGYLPSVSSSLASSLAQIPLAGRVMTTPISREKLVTLCDFLQKQCEARNAHDIAEYARYTGLVLGEIDTIIEEYKLQPVTETIKKSCTENEEWWNLAFCMVGRTAPGFQIIRERIQQCASWLRDKPDKNVLNYLKHLGSCYSRPRYSGEKDNDMMHYRECNYTLGLPIPLLPHSQKQIEKIKKRFMKLEQAHSDLLEEKRTKEELESITSWRGSIARVFKECRTLYQPHLYLSIMTPEERVKRKQQLEQKLKDKSEIYKAAKSLLERDSTKLPIIENSIRYAARDLRGYAFTLEEVHQKRAERKKELLQKSNEKIIETWQRNHIDEELSDLEEEEKREKDILDTMSDKRKLLKNMVKPECCLADRAQVINFIQKCRDYPYTTHYAIKLPLVPDALKVTGQEWWWLWVCAHINKEREPIEESLSYCRMKKQKNIEKIRAINKQIIEEDKLLESSRPRYTGIISLPFFLIRYMGFWKKERSTNNDLLALQARKEKLYHKRAQYNRRIVACEDSGLYRLRNNIRYQNLYVKTEVDHDKVMWLAHHINPIFWYAMSPNVRPKKESTPRSMFAHLLNQRLRRMNSRHGNHMV